MFAVQNRKGKGTFHYLTNQGLPVFLTHGERVQDVVPLDLLSLDGRKAQRGLIATEVRAMNRNSPRDLALILVPTTVCAMSCAYCYARQDDGKHGNVNFDLRRLEKFLSVHGKKFKRAIVYGGDSLMQDGLAKLLRDGTSPECGICFVTGLGYPRPVFQRKVEAALDQGIRFSLSIDAPPVDGHEYGRVYSLYPGNKGLDWYHELLSRAAFIDKAAAARKINSAWGVRPTITGSAYDHRALREDLKRAVQHDDISINIEPAVSGYDTDSPKHEEALVNIGKILQADVDDILDGKLRLDLNQHFREKVLNVVSPAIHFSRGGCYSYFSRIAIGPRGELTFCNEAPTYPENDRTPWLFGEIDHPDRSSYAKVLGQVYNRPPDCHKCDHRFSCGTHCPIKLLKRDLDGCPFSMLHSFKLMYLLANLDNADEVWRSTFPARVKNLRRWIDTPELSAADLENHIDWMLS